MMTSFKELATWNIATCSLKNYREHVEIIRDSEGSHCKVTDIRMILRLLDMLAQRSVKTEVLASSTHRPEHGASAQRLYLPGYLVANLRHTQLPAQNFLPCSWHAEEFSIVFQREPGTGGVSPPDCNEIGLNPPIPESRVA
jgi:hypothetical protein